MKLLQDRHTRGRERDNRFVRACAVDMRMGMSEEPFYARSCRKNAAPEIPTHSLCEAVQSCAWKRHKSHLLRELRGKCRAPRLRRTVPFVRWCAVVHMDVSQEPCPARIYGKNAAPTIATHSLCERVQSKGTWTWHKGQCTQEFTGKVSWPTIAMHSLCEPAQSNCTSTCYKSDFMREFIGKMVGSRWSTMIKPRRLHLP